MGDVGDYWRDVKDDMKAESKARRRHNREHSAGILRQAGVPFTEHNGGAHLFVTGARGIADFWPGTGKWILRSPDPRGGHCLTGRGVRNLLKEISP